MLTKINKLLFLLLFLEYNLFNSIIIVNAQSQNVKNYIVKFKGDLELPEKATVSEVCKTLHGNFERNYTQFKNFYKNRPIKKLWIINAIGIQATAYEVRQIKQLNFVDYVKESKYRVYLPPEPETSKSEEEIYSTKQEQLWNINKIEVPRVWQELGIDGSGVLVGHLDTGVDIFHPALRNKVVLFKDFTKPIFNESTEQSVEVSYDDHGHGTHTAGTIVGDFGIGVAPQAKLIVAKVFDSKGGAEDIWLLDAMQWMLDPDQNPDTDDSPKVISNSWGSDSVTDKTFWNAVRAWAAAGILPVFAAGNNGPIGKVGTPAGFPFSFAVGATTSDDKLAYFSSVGPSVWDGITLIKPDVTAPGQSILSCAIGNGYIYKSGTSMACPHVAGLCALIMQANPSLDIEKIRFIIEYTSHDLGKPGKDTKFGSGRINAYNAVKLAIDSLQPHSLFEEYERVLYLEQNLLKDNNFGQLSSPLAQSIVKRFSENVYYYNCMQKIQSLEKIQSCISNKINNNSKFSRAVNLLIKEIHSNAKAKFLHTNK